MPSKKKTTKKAAPKRAAKKVAKKVTRKSTKKTTRSGATKKSACACQKKCKKTDAFWVHNGPIVHSLEQLRDALKEMSEEQYTHHTQRGDGNDFACWIEDCFKDTTCAKKVARAKTRVGTVRILNKTCSCK